MSARKVDVLLCVGVVVVLAVVVNSHEGRAEGPVNPLAYVWAAGLGALMLVRRSHPLLVLALTALGFFSYYAAGFPAIGVAVPIAAALYSAAEMGHVRAAAATGAGTLTLATGYRVLAGQDAAYVLGYELVTHAALIAAVVALGHTVRTSRRLRRRTEQVTRLLARQNELDADARLREDRFRLARELHDSIGHSLSVASLYTDVAREAGGQRTDALDLVRTAISDALSHLRRTVAVLRSRESELDMSNPGLADISRLVAAPTAAGYDVDVRVADVEVPPEVEAAAFRLVQEAVTNTLRHSSGSRIGVRVAERPPGVLDVQVRDDGRIEESVTFRPGHGLSGMRERVADLGGTLEVEADGSGWLVRAAIPLKGAR
jgi:signal transduction histidine kinase